MMYPSLKNVATSLIILCKTNDVFTPSMLRQLLGRDFSETEPTMLSAQIQPHLRALRQAGVISLIHSNKKRNRPYRLINRETLYEASSVDNYYFPQSNEFELPNDDDEDSFGPDEQISISKDDTTDIIIDMERRIIEIEEKVDDLIEKLSAVSTVLRRK